MCAPNAVEVILEHIRGTESIAARFHGEQLLHLLFDASPTVYLRKHAENFEGTPDISVSLDGTRVCLVFDLFRVYYSREENSFEMILGALKALDYEKESQNPANTFSIS